MGIKGSNRPVPPSRHYHNKSKNVAPPPSVPAKRSSVGSKNSIVKSSDPFASWNNTADFAAMIGGERRFHFDFMNSVYDEEAAATGVGKGSKKRKKVVSSGGRGAAPMAIDQQLIVQNQDPYPTLSWRCRTEEDCYSPKNYAPNVSNSNTDIFCILKGEIAFSIYGGPSGYKARTIGGVPYAKNETVLTNLTKAICVIEGWVINPGATRGRIDSNRDQYCVLGKLGVITLINNSPYHLHVSDLVIGVFEAHTIRDSSTGQLVAAVQAHGTSDRTRKQRFLVQTVPIRSTSVSCNQQHITIALRIELRKAGERNVGNPGNTDYLKIFLTQTVPEILKNMGFSLFKPFMDWGRAQAIFLSYAHIIDQQGIRQKGDAEDKDKDTMALPSVEWFNTVTNELKKLYSNQMSMTGTYDTDLTRFTTLNSVTKKNSEERPIVFFDQQFTNNTSGFKKKQYLAQILFAVDHLKTLTHNQAYDLILRHFIGKVTTEAHPGHWWNVSTTKYQRHFHTQNNTNGIFHSLTHSRSLFFSFSSLFSVCGRGNKDCLLTHRCF